VTELDTLLSAYDDQMRRAETTNLPIGVFAERDGSIVRVVGQYRGFISAKRDVGIGSEELDALIARQRDYFAARGEAVEWKTRGNDLPVDIVKRLQAAGFVAEEQETVLIGIAEVIARHDTPLPPGVTLRQTTSEDDMRRVAAMESKVWGTDLAWMAEHLVRQTQNAPDQIAVVIAEEADEVVSAGWLVYEAGTECAGLRGGSTLAECRRKGIYRAIVSHRAHLACNRGVRYLQVDASENSRPILERLGFLAVTPTTPYVLTPPASP